MEKKLLKRIEEMGDGEREKLRELLKDSKGDSSPKLNWMYKDKADNEEFLLGRRIDKTMIVDEETPATAVPGALFSEVISRRSELDMQVKMREDPLYMIRKREEDAKRKLLENPVKMKQLQKVIDEKKRQHKEKKKKKSKKHKKSSDDSDDELLRKYLSIVEQKKSKVSRNEDSVASASGGSRSNNSKDHRSSDKGDSSDRRQSDSRHDRQRLESATRDNDRTVGKKHRHGGRHTNHHDDRHASPSNHHSNHHDDGHASPSNHHSKRKRKTSRDSDEEPRSRSRSPRSNKPQGYGLIRRGGETTAAPVHMRPSAPPPRISPSKSIAKPQPQSVSKEKRKLTAEEKEQKLAAMMANARDRDDQRHRNVQHYRAEDERDKKKMSEQLESHDADFVKPLVMKHASQSSVEDRIKRNVYNIQRTHSALDTNFARH